MSAASGCRKSRWLFRQSEKKTGGDLPSVLGIEYTLSKTILGKSAVISENQTATSDGETVKTKNSNPQIRLVTKTVR